MHAIHHVKIQVAYVRQYHRHSAVGKRIGDGVARPDGAPHVHAGKHRVHLGVIVVAMTGRHFLPAFHLNALLGKPVGYSEEIMLSHVALVLIVVFLH